jgi:hypothetical protein
MAGVKLIRDAGMEVVYLSGTHVNHTLRLSFMYFTDRPVDVDGQAWCLSCHRYLEPTEVRFRRRAA